MVLGTETVTASFSADIGCVRLTERCLHSDPPRSPRWRRPAMVRDRLGNAVRIVPVERARSGVGLARHDDAGRCARP